KYVRNSLHSCAASVLLCAMTSVGRCTSSMTPAIVIVLPVPVAPSSVMKRSPARSPSDVCAIALGWSAAGVKIGSSLNSGISGGPRELHAPQRAGLRGPVVAELGLGVDDRRDQGQVEVLLARLLADDVLVAQRQRELLEGVAQHRPERDDHDRGHEHEEDPPPP